MAKAASAETAPVFELVVTENFDGHARGDVITDPEQIQALLASEWAAFCVKRQA